MPIEPPPSRFQLPTADAPAQGDVVGVGGDLEPGTLLGAYRSGIFPMRVGKKGPIGWWSPEERGVIPLDGLRVTRSLTKSCRRFEVRVDVDFEATMRACGDVSRAGGWIDESFVNAYSDLHQLGWAHSIEVFLGDTRVGGCYGVGIGGFFAGESMFYSERDASKAALVTLVELLRESGALLLDVQWVTPHLASLGAIAVTRATYLGLLAQATAVPGPNWDEHRWPKRNNI